MDTEKVLGDVASPTALGCCLLMLSFATAVLLLAIALKVAW